MDFDDRIWPKLLQRVCSASLATVWFEAIADLDWAVAAGYTARPRFPLEGADYSVWLQAAERHGYRSRLAAATLTATLERRAEVEVNSFLTAEIDAAALTSDAVMGIIKGGGDLSSVVFEVTRLQHHRDHRTVLHALDVAREQGARVALRATGIGSADLVQVADVAPQFIKVGPELIAGVDQLPRRAAMLAAVGAVADRLQATVIAGGVEHAGELRALRELGIPLAQGALIASEGERMAGLAPATAAFLRGPLAGRGDTLGVLPADPSVHVA